MLDGTKNPATGLIWTPEDLKLIRQSPARTLGWWLGKTKLQEMHDIWIKHIWANTPGMDSSLMAHRGSYKTTAITEIGTIWNWLWNPDDRVALTRETHTVAAETLATIAKHMEVPWLRSLFDYWHGKGTSEAVVNREGKVQYAFKKTVTKEGSCEAFGILRVPTGFHCDKVLGDDFVTKEDKYSRAKREKTRAAIEEIQTNIVDPGGECHWVGTPWHKEDAWSCVPKAAKFPRKKTGLLPDEDYEKVIFRILEDGRRVRKISKSQEAANYDLEHIADEGMLFAELSHVNIWQNGIQDVVAHIDARFQGTHWTALTIAARLPDGRIQITGYAWEKHIDDLESEIDALLIRYKVRRLTQERNPDKGYSLKRAMSRWSSKGMRISVPKDTRGEYGYQEGTNKHNKILSHLLSNWGNLVWDSDCQEDYLDQVLNYREGEEPDDAPDSAASLLREFYDETKPKGSNWRIS
jgi:hypothetical protein